MKTLFLIALLILVGVIAKFLFVLILNLGGLPGALIAGKPYTRSKFQLTLGTILSALGQSYISLTYTAFIVSWTFLNIKEGINFKFLVWIFAFLAVFIPMWFSLIAARVEDKENGLNFANPQVEALHLTTFLTIVVFFIFLFVPSSMTLLWSWIPFVPK